MIIDQKLSTILPNLNSNRNIVPLTNAQNTLDACVMYHITIY